MHSVATLKQTSHVVATGLTLFKTQWLHTIYTTSCDIKKFFVLPTQCIYVYCVDLKTNSDYFPIQH